MLAEVFIPGADDELLEDAVRDRPHRATCANSDRARAASGIAPGVQRVDEVPLTPGLWPVLERHQHWPARRCLTDELRIRPVTRR